MSLPDETLVRAIQSLAGVCDGARQQDGIGFNGPDSKFGKALGNTPTEVWTPDVQYRAWEMVQKYKGQLALLGIDVTGISEPVASGVSRAKADIRAIDVRNGKVLVFLPYGDSAYPKSALSATWNSTEKGWQVPVAKYGAVMAWANRNDVPVTNRAKAILAEAPPSSAPAHTGTATLKGDNIVLKFDYHPKMVDAVRIIPGRKWDDTTKSWLIPTGCAIFAHKLADDFGIHLSDEVKALPIGEVSSRPKVSVQGQTFTLAFSYDAALITQVRAMPGAVWSPNIRLWVVPVESVQEVLSFAREHDAIMSPEATRLVEQAADVQKVIAASAAHDAELVIDGFGSETYQLFPFQRAGVAYAVRQMGFVQQPDNSFVKENAGTAGVIIGDEMGLGKTPQGLGVIAATQAFPAVVVCPASLKLNWKREAERWIPGKVVKVISGTTGNLPDADIYVINYDILTHWVDRFITIKGLVLDESHYIKNGQAQRSKACIRMADKVTDDGVRVCLSGTPIVNQPLELMTQLRVINRLTDFGGATGYRNTYGRATARSLASLNRKLRSSCYVRRRKADVLTELPPKVWADVIIEGDPKVMKEYRKAEADIVKYLSELALELARESGATTEEARKEAWRRALRARAAEHLVSITTLKKLAARAKMKAAEQWVEDFLATDKKLVVFGWHREIVDNVAEKFSNGIKIQGGMTSEKRQEAVDLFQGTDEQKIVACNLKAAGVGLTLTAASDVLFIEQGWTPSDMDQAVDRCHRIGQQDSVTGWLMLAADTIDEDIAALINHKRAIVERAIDGSDDDDREENNIIGELLVNLAERGLRNAE